MDFLIALTDVQLFTYVLRWYIPLFIAGIIFLPVTSRLFASFVDKGYPFAKTIAIMVTSYLLLVLGIFKIAPFSFTTIILVLISITVFSIPLILLKQKPSKYGWKPILFIIFEELVFFLSLYFLAYVRSQEPSIHGLEKYMDFGFIQSILRSRFFPPLDMWLSADTQNPQGFFINYYYFGHLTGAFLIKLSNISSEVGYNLILATIFAQGITLTFSLALNLMYAFTKKCAPSFLGAILSTFIVNFGGNLHTIYLFTSGYPAEKPIPFWQILSTYNPTKYWYPNATRFIPFTIHEFPSYSYVVADLHGHVFDIPFVLTTLAILLVLFLNHHVKKHKDVITHTTISSDNPISTTSNGSQFKSSTSLAANQSQPIPTDSNQFQPISTNFNRFQPIPTDFNRFQPILPIILSFLTAIHYMTNAFDGPIYILLAGFVFFILFGISKQFVISSLLLVLGFIVFSFPFSMNFVPFASGIGVNCSPTFLTNIGKIGPFLFEKGNCQPDPLWMLFVLWGFFIFHFIILSIVTFLENHRNKSSEKLSLIHTDVFVYVLFLFGTFLITIPEFFYVKDIYPAHFRANTMFKMGYQAFIMMGIASIYTILRTLYSQVLHIGQKTMLFFCSLILLFFVSIYSFYAFPSYYGSFVESPKTPNMNGLSWLKTSYPEDLELIRYMNTHITGQPVILEAQGDSYTDYDRISAYTGLPTIAGWWVHEWLWRGSSSIVGDRIPDINALYEDTNLENTKKLLEKYHVEYVVVSRMEREKYKNLQEDKFEKLGRKIFESKNRFGALYQVKKSRS